MSRKPTKTDGFAALLADVKGRIQTSQARAVLAVNAELVRLYWDIGRIIDQRQEREGWGAAVIPRLAAELKNELPELKGFSERNMGLMIRFYREYPTPESILQPPVAKLPSPLISPPPVAKLPGPISQVALPKLPDDTFWAVSWAHHVILMQKVKDLPTRRWYMEQTLANGWSRDFLALQIDSQAHARHGKAASNFAAVLPPAQSDAAQQLLKDPYIFDFLTLSEPFHERELETELVKHLEQFLLELGQGFAFVGRQYRRDILQEKRAGYGEEIVSTPSRQLASDYGNGYSRPNLFRMLRLAEVFPEPGIVSTLSKQLGWSHFVEIIPIKDQLKRDFYAEMCRADRWSVRKLRDKIDGMLFERTALSKKPEKLAAQELAQLRAEYVLSPDMVIRDPYFLDFLDLKDTYSENDLETAIIREMESFLLELGEGFAFVARQKRMVIDGKDFVLDLLFYHRYLRRLVAIDLKLEEFKPAHKGQMELYLRWLDKHERQPGEESPLGLILCESAGAEQIELLQLGQDGIRIGTYLTELPPKQLLEQKLRAATALARQRLAETLPVAKKLPRRKKGVAK